MISTRKLFVSGSVERSDQDNLEYIRSNKEYETVLENEGRHSGGSLLAELECQAPGSEHEYAEIKAYGVNERCQHEDVVAVGATASALDPCCSERNSDG